MPKLEPELPICKNREQQLPFLAVIGFGEADENEWIIDDGSGQVRVDGGSRKKRNINLSKGETIVVVGEMDEDEFDAFSITRWDGSTINIRSPKRRQHSDDHDDDDR
ncbi:hypothetical protein [Microcoleus sp. B4-D4]|uniref:hypothetical protein n=1 Tax=Microcoleus sp. B4-D4 TaxID=2818667 RepID=UPI002FCE87B3